MTLLSILSNEVKALLRNPVIVLTIFGGVLFYSFLYPLPYSHQVPREQEITVVNLDKSLTSFRLERMVDATPQVKIVSRAHSLADAKNQFQNGNVSGILVIPEHFYRDLLLSRSPVLSFAADASYFLVYGTIAEGLLGAGSTLAGEVTVSRILAEGVPMESAAVRYASSRLNMKPTFNPEFGYVNYVVPAVFIFILQQTLIMGSGIQGGSQRFGKGYWSSVKPFTLIISRALVFSAIYLFLSFFYFGFSFEYYGIHRLANPSELVVLLIPFLLTACFIGHLLGAILPRRELVTVVVLLSSMPLIFSSGFIWPVENIPEVINLVASVFPSAHVIQAMLKLNQMGAEFNQVIHHWTALWGQAVFWGAMALLAERYQRKAVL